MNFWVLEILQIISNTALLKLLQGFSQSGLFWNLVISNPEMGTSQELVMRCHQASGRLLLGGDLLIPIPPSHPHLFQGNLHPLVTIFLHQNEICIPKDWFFIVFHSFSWFFIVIVCFILGFPEIITTNNYYHKP